MIYTTDKISRFGERREQLTRKKLEALGFSNCTYTPNIIEYHGRNWRKEYISAYFNDGTENQTVPNQIDFEGLNNSVTLSETDDMDFEHFIMALWFVYDTQLMDDPISKLFHNLPLDIECKVKYK